jgi:protein translocase SecG subunit
MRAQRPVLIGALDLLLATVFALLAASPAAALPTPIPAPTFIFHQTTPLDQYPWVVNLIQALFLVSTVALIALMSAQTTKNEGLSGSIGGRADSAYHGRLGLDQQITRLTTFTASAWIVLAVAFFFATPR